MVFSAEIVEPWVDGRIRVAHVVPSIENRASGTSYCVTELTRVLAEQDCGITLYVLGQVPMELYPSITVRSFDRWRFAGRLGISPEMRKSMRIEIKKTDILHNHGLWMMPNIYAGQAVVGTSCRFVISPHGTMADWAWAWHRNRKRLIGWLGQNEALRRASCFHATAKAEVADIRRRGYRQPIAVIPNGVDIPVLDQTKKKQRVKELLYAGRLHPKKGLVNLIRAWAVLAPLFEDWELNLVGPDDGGHMSDLQGLISELRCPRVVFKGSLFGVDLVRAYQSASLFVMPTFSENFGITVAEALANSIPAIVTRGAPWSGLETERCGWWIDVGEAPLLHALEDAMNLSETVRADMGSRGRLWMKRDFGWGKIGNQMIKTYEWLIGGGTAPDWVELG